MMYKLFKVLNICKLWYSKYSMKFLVLKHDLMSLIVHKYDALREIHEYAFELFVHAADLCKLKQLRFISLLHLVQCNDHKDHGVADNRDSYKIDIVEHDGVVG